MMEHSRAPLIGISTCVEVGLHDRPDKTYQSLEISYCEAAAEAGAIPVIIPFLRDASLYGEVLGRVDGLIISGGESLPSGVPGEEPEVPLDLAPECRMTQDHALVEGALSRGLPILGICYGMQFVNLHLGGTLYYDIRHQLPDAEEHRPGDPAFRHTVRIEDGTRLRSILACERAAVNSSHHQAVRRIGSGLKVSAVCEDGIVEAIESQGDNFLLGIQWHPEKIVDENRRKIFSALVDACGAGMPRG